MNDLEVVLRLRKCAPACTVDCEERLVQRVEALEETAHVTATRVETWDRLRLRSPKRPEQLAVIDRFARWAARNGLTLEPAFQRREVTTFVHPKERVEIVVPVACLAVYEDDDLRTVAPCSNGEHVETVGDALARLERGEIHPALDSLEPGADTGTLVDISA